LKSTHTKNERRNLLRKKKKKREKIKKKGWEYPARNGGTNHGIKKKSKDDQKRGTIMGKRGNEREKKEGGKRVRDYAQQTTHQS